MVAKNYEEIMQPLVVGVFCLPRSGSTILTSFLNSIDRSVFLSEPHGRHQPKKKIPTRYGDLLYGETVMGSLLTFSCQRELTLVGYKEIWHPIQEDRMWAILDKDFDHFDLIVTTLRDPLRIYSSISHTELPEKKFNRVYIEFHEKMKSLQAKTVVLDKFRRNPSGHINTVLPFDVPRISLIPRQLQGGDPYAIRADKVDAAETREPWPRRNLMDAVRYYEQQSQSG